MILGQNVSQRTKTFNVLFDLVWYAAGVAVLFGLNRSWMPSTYLHSLYAITGYFTVTVLVHARVKAYPNSHPGSYSVIVATIFFGVTLIALYTMELRLSVKSLLAAYAITVAWLWIKTLIKQRITAYNLALIPGGLTAALADGGGGDFVMLTKPAMLRDIDAIVYDPRHDHGPQWRSFMAESSINGVPVLRAEKIYEGLYGKIPLSHLDEESFEEFNINRSYAAVKRMVDLLLCLLFSPVILLLAGLTALSIRIEGGGPVIFSQIRTGYKDKPFRIFKFRTMRCADEQKGPTATSTNDARITGLGRFLRRFRLDEIPQVINILRGEMSLIGPRPEQEALTGEFSRQIEFFRYRHAVRPGITGWAQVCHGYTDDARGAEEKLAYDLYYIKNFSLWLDFIILTKTVRTVAVGNGAR
jgi:UDP-GalNAc:undecaprenyl-phosphate GalNAc-1-phosphate transferase